MAALHFCESNLTMPGRRVDLRDSVIAGEKIYDELYRDRFESAYPDHFAAIDLRSGMAFVGKNPEEAIDEARSQIEGALVHVVRIGFPSAFRVSFVVDADDADLARRV